MANIKITDLTAYTDPLNTDVLPIVDVTSDTTKKVSIADLLKNASAGTAAAPGIAFDGDSNTGIYSPGADQVAISTNGTGRLFIDASGNVGIGGATSPTTSLHVGPGVAATVLDGAGAYFVPQIYNAQTTAGVAGIGVHTNDGTNNRRAGLFVDNANSLWGLSLNWSSGITIPFVIRDAVGERLRITSDGELGLGTSSPNAKLHVRAANSDTVATLLRLEQFNAAQTDSARLLITADAANNLVTYDASGFNNASHVFLTGGLERARIDTSGTFRVRGNTSNTPGTNDAVQLNGSAPANSLLLDASGRVLVGTASNSGGALLQVNGNRIRIATAKTPASATDTGTAGEICWDADYVYVCTATNTWKRTAIATW